MGSSWQNSVKKSCALKTCLLLLYSREHRKDRKGKGRSEARRREKKCIGFELRLMQCMIGERLPFFCITFIIDLVLCLLTFVFK